MDFPGDEKTAVLLVDNGSLRPESTLQLRRIAAQLGERTGRPIEPVSTRHSNRISAEKLDGTPAEIFDEAIARLCGEGRTNFAIVPDFFGPSEAVTSYIPERLKVLRGRFPRISAVIGRPLVDAADTGDTRIAQILADHVAEVWKKAPDGERGPVVVVDHGSPVEAVAAVRNHVAAQLASLLGDRFPGVLPASMERRPGPEYAFNEPLLADLLPMLGSGDDQAPRVVTVAMLFLAPGRHAGANGDVAQICEKAIAATPGLEVRRTRLVGEHRLLLDILADRCSEAIELLGSGGAGQ